MYGLGISKIGEIIDLAAEAKIVEKSGAWYAYNGEKLGQGKESVKALLSQNDKLREELEAKVRTHFEINRSKKNEKEKEAK
jgi:recombination protein RecA